MKPKLLLEIKMKNAGLTLGMLALLVMLSACSVMQKKGTKEPGPNEFTPKLRRPEVRKVWVPDEIVGDEYITGHWKYVLEKNAVWAKDGGR
jgi:hypothetical protein